jgi:hypothetical protein
MALWLSQKRVVAWVSGLANSPISDCSQINSFVACVDAINSASVEDKAMTGYFLELQEIAPPSIRKIYPDIEWQ